MVPRAPARALAALALAACVRDGVRPPSEAAGAEAALGRELEPFVVPALAGGTLAFDPRDGLRIGTKNVAPAVLIVHVLQPDCPACLAEARALEALRVGGDAVVRVGLAHRGGREELEQFRERSGVTYPLGHVAGTAWARRWSRGDPTYVVDARGRIVYAQVGFHASDIRVWEEVVAELVAGRPAPRAGPDRPAITAGERMPRIELPELATGQIAVLDSSTGALVLRRNGSERPLRAAVGFFSRY